MPQLDFSTYLTQIFWVITTFSCLWFVMDKFIVPKVSEQVEARKRKYNELILKAEEINKKATLTEEQYKKDLAEAKAKATAKIKQNEEELKDFIALKEKEVELELKSKFQKSETQLIIDKNFVLKQIDELSEKVANDVLNKLDLGINISKEDFDKVANQKRIDK